MKPSAPFFSDSLTHAINSSLDFGSPPLRVIGRLGTIEWKLDKSFNPLELCILIKSAPNSYPWRKANDKLSISLSSFQDGRTT
jgi:hypothetical protein